ncbi:hypothetical protein ACJMK2_013690 [Sinanodonta woodiana]|uniref:TIR domain-containing protein n=1 Tax=Sinanodonta woodiana TaxID=1069815 RepID=A0ABD3UY96_SINWO
MDLSEFYYKEITVNETLTVINITNTSIDCDCSADSKRYFEWFLGSKNNSRIQPYPYVGTCGNYYFREMTSYASYRDIMVDKCKIDENYLTLAISLPISIGIIICCIAVIVCYKVQRRNNNIRPVFISAANDDLHVFVMNMLLPRLKEELAKERHFNCRIEVMPFITGFDMTPGENIEDQIQSFVKESLCVIAIISENFLESPYCSRELEIAQQMQRKIIPLCIDNCKQKLNDVTTHKVIKDVMQKYAYIQWPLVADVENVIQDNENGIEDNQHVNEREECAIEGNYNVNLREENLIEIEIDGNQAQNMMKDNPSQKAIKQLVESIRRTYLYSIPR